MANVTSILTDYGNNAILKAIAEEKNVYVAAMICGDGGGYSYTPSSSQTALVNQVLELTNLTKRFDEEDGFIYFSATIPANAPGFIMREVGLVDPLGNLLAITTIPDTSKPEAEEGLEVSLPVSIGFKTSTGEVMLVYVDQGDEFPDKIWVVEQITEIDHISGRNW